MGCTVARVSAHRRFLPPEALCGWGVALRGNRFVVRAGKPQRARYLRGGKGVNSVIRIANGVLEGYLAWAARSRASAPPAVPTSRGIMRVGSGVAWEPICGQSRLAGRWGQKRAEIPVIQIANGVLEGYLAWAARSRASAPTGGSYLQRHYAGGEWRCVGTALWSEPVVAGTWRRGGKGALAEPFPSIARHGGYCDTEMVAWEL